MTKKVPALDPVAVEDVYAGQGGSYLLDPVSGQRVLQDRTAPADGAIDMTKEQENGTTEA